MPVFTVCFIIAFSIRVPLTVQAKPGALKGFVQSVLSTTPKKLDLSWNIVGIEDDASDDGDDEVIFGNSCQKISEKLDAINKLLSLGLGLVACRLE